MFSFTVPCSVPRCCCFIMVPQHVTLTVPMMSGTHPFTEQHDGDTVSEILQFSPMCVWSMVFSWSWCLVGHGVLYLNCKEVFNVVREASTFVNVLV